MASLQNRLIRAVVRSGARSSLHRSTIVDMARQGLEQAGTRLPRPRGVRYSRQRSGPVRAMWVEPENVRPDGVLLYFHGGGYVGGSPRSHAALVGRIARSAELRALSVDYRLAPEHPFPAGLNDALAAFDAIVAEGVGPDQIVLAGDSAGGGLVLATLLSLRDRGDRMPAAAALLSPWTDMSTSGASMKTRARADPLLTPGIVRGFARHYLGGADPKHPLASPVFADLGGLPALLIHVGADEVLLDDSRRLADNARAAAVDVHLEIWPEMMHVFHMLSPFLPEAKHACREVGEFLRARVAQ